MTFQLHEYTNQTRMERNVRHGDTLSPQHVMRVFKRTFKRLKWGCITIDVEKLNHFRWANDTVIKVDDLVEIKYAARTRGCMWASCAQDEL